MDEYLEVAKTAAEAAGQLLLDWQHRISTKEKAPKDLVTEADLASQAKIKEIVLGAFPSHGFLGEENVDLAASRDGYRWIVDPLDGTTNYVHRLQNFSVSVALELDGEAIVGLVLDPIGNECFWAIRGRGAFVNGEPLRVSDCTELSQALVAASLSPAVKRDTLEVDQFLEILVSCQALRRLGSAALNLCYLAGGRLDAYWATSVKIWDVAAGMLIVAEAGGHVTTPEGDPFDLQRPRFAAAATVPLHRQLVERLAACGAEGRGS